MMPGQGPNGFGPPGYRSNAPPPPYVPSREAVEAERLARQAREKRQAEDQLVVTIYKVVGGIGVLVALLLVFVNLRAGNGALAGRIVLRSLVIAVGGGGLFARGNMLAKRHNEPDHAALNRIYLQQSLYAQNQPPPPATHAQPAQPPAPGAPPPITRWTD